MRTRPMKKTYHIPKTKVIEVEGLDGLLQAPSVSGPGGAGGGSNLGEGGDGWEEDVD